MPAAADHGERRQLQVHLYRRALWRTTECTATCPESRNDNVDSCPIVAAILYPAFKTAGRACPPRARRGGRRSDVRLSITKFYRYET